MSYPVPSVTELQDHDANIAAYRSIMGHGNNEHMSLYLTQYGTRFDDASTCNAVVADWSVLVVMLMNDPHA